MKTCIAILSCFLVLACHSQETIIFKNGEKLKVKIISRDYQTVTYTVPPDTTVRITDNKDVYFVSMSGETTIPKIDTNVASGPELDEEWKYVYDYQKIMNAYKPGFSEEVIAGDLFMRAGHNFQAAGFCGLGTVILGVGAVIIPQTTSDPETIKTATYIIGGAAGVLGIISVAELIAGGTKLIKGGIVLQHKRFRIAPGSISYKIN